jgi:cation diffusion facilitator family transporter
MGKLRAASVSIGINIALLLSKIIAAIITGSVGLLAEAIHSSFDLIASVLAFIGIKKAEEPDDLNHHYGHEKFENLSSLLQALIITGTSFIVMWEAYHKFKNPTPVENSMIGIILMAVTIPITYLTARYLSKIAKAEGGSQALEADSSHFTTDVLGSIAVLLGLLMVKFGMGWGDALAAFIVGLIMLYISIELGIHSFYVFMDFSPDKSKIAKIKRVLDSSRKKKMIMSYHKLKARMAGSKILLEFHILVPKKLDIATAHQISADIKRAIKKAVPEVKEATIHIEPDS